MKSNKKIARIIGTLFLAGMVIGITGNILVQSTLDKPDYLSKLSENSLKLAIGAVLMLMTSIWDATHGILMFPILKTRSERLALGYLGFRIFDAVFLGIQVLLILLQMPLGNEYIKEAADTTHLQFLGSLLIKANIYSYQIGMIALGIAGLMLNYVFYKAKLVPHLVAIWGFIGYATILSGSILEVIGFDLLFLHTIPGGLWELFIGFLLIAKGFNPSAILPETKEL